VTTGKPAPRASIAEKALLAPLRRLFPAERFALRTEVPFRGKNIDVLLLDRKTRRLVAVELKVRKWRKALRQAAVYQLGAHQVYVALWHKHVSDERVARMSSHGLGVIEIAEGPRRRWTAHVVAKPKRTSLLNRRYAHDLRGEFV